MRAYRTMSDHCFDHACEPIEFCHASVVQNDANKFKERHSNAKLDVVAAEYPTLCLLVSVRNYSHTGSYCILTIR